MSLITNYELFIGHENLLSKTIPNQLKPTNGDRLVLQNYFLLKVTQ
ncbi:hypothetical protein [Nostoc sp. WHI]|nr:hypothetical protein [Nostoc sp. WHI]